MVLVILALVALAEVGIALLAIQLLYRRSYKLDLCWIKGRELLFPFRRGIR